MAGMSAMSTVEPEHSVPLKTLHEGLMPLAALAFARFPEVMMALGSPTLGRDFELPPARSACTVIEETGDYKLVQILVRRVGSHSNFKLGVPLRCQPNTVQQQAMDSGAFQTRAPQQWAVSPSSCSLPIPGGGTVGTCAPPSLGNMFRGSGETPAAHQTRQADAAAGRSVARAGTAARPAHLAPRVNASQRDHPMNGNVEFPTTFDGAGCAAQRNGYVPVGTRAEQREQQTAPANGCIAAYAARSGGCGRGSDFRSGAPDRGSDSKACNRKRGDECVSHACPSAEDWLPAETNATEWAKEVAKTAGSFVSSAENWLPAQANAKENVRAAEHPRLQAGSSSPAQANPMEAPSTGKTDGQTGPAAEDWLSVQANPKEKTHDIGNVAGVSRPSAPTHVQAAPNSSPPNSQVAGVVEAAQVDVKSEAQNDRAEPQAQQQRTTQTRNDTPVSAAAAPQRQFQPQKKDKQRSGRKAPLSSLKEEAFEPASPRSPGCYQPWGPTFAVQTMPDLPDLGRSTF